MDRFLTFLGEAFPPPKKSPTDKPKGTNSPFDSKDRAPQEKPNPGFNQQKSADKGFKQSADGDEPEIKTDRVEVGPGQGQEKTAELDKQQGIENQGPPQQGQQPGFGPQPMDPLAAMQWQAQQEKEQQELLMRQQKQAEADAEAQAVKKLRAQAEQEVAAALEDKYNASDDSVEFYPELLTFGQFTKDGKQDAGGPGQQPGTVGDRYPEDAGKNGKLKKGEDDDEDENDEDDLNDTSEKQDARQDEEDETDPNPDEEDEEDVESQRQKRQKDAQNGDNAKQSNKQQKKW